MRVHMDLPGRAAFTLMAEVQGVGLTTESQVLISLVYHLERQGYRVPWESETLAERLGWSVRSLYRRVEECERAGWLQRQGRALLFVGRAKVAA